MPVHRSSDNFKFRPGGASVDVVNISSTGVTITGSLAVTGSTPWAPDVVTLFTGIATEPTSQQTVTTFEYDTAKHPGTSVVLEALLESTSESVTASLELFNVTDNVTVYTLTSVSTIPEYVTHAVTMASGSKVYALILHITDGGALDAATLTMARLRIS